MAMEETDRAKSCNPLCTHGTINEGKYSEDLRTNVPVEIKTDKIVFRNKADQTVKKPRNTIT